MSDVILKYKAYTSKYIVTVEWNQEIHIILQNVYVCVYLGYILGGIWKYCVVVQEDTHMLCDNHYSGPLS